MENQVKDQNTMEKSTFYLGLTILILLIGYLVFQLITNENEPPSLVIHTAYEPSMSGNTFKVEVRNNGHETAQSVNITFNLYQNDTLAESADLLIDYVPIKSKEQAWLIFSKKSMPSDSLSVGPISFLKP